MVRGYAHNIPEYTMCNTQFRNLSTRRQKKHFVERAQNFLTNISGGDVRSLLEALASDDITFTAPKASASTEDYKLLKSVSDCIELLGETEDLEALGVKRGSKTGVSHEDHLGVKTLRSVVVHSKMSLKQITDFFPAKYYATFEFSRYET